MYKFCYIHNSQWHYNVVSFWWWNIPYTSQLCRVGLFLKGTSVKLQCLVFCLLTSACSSKPNSGIIFFQEIFPNPPSHLPPFLPDYFPCPFAVLSVPGTSLCFSTCYTVMLYCHCLSFPHLCPLRVWSSWGQKANLLPVVLARALDLVGAQWIPAEWMGFFPSISEDVDVEDNRCFFYLISNPSISQIFIPLHMTILLWMCIVGAFFEYSQCRRERRKRRNLYWVVTLRTFSINIKNHLRNNLCVSTIISIIQKLSLRKIKKLVNRTPDDRGGIHLTPSNTTLPLQGEEGVMGTLGCGRSRSWMVGWGLMLWTIWHVLKSICPPSCCLLTPNFSPLHEW